MTLFRKIHKDLIEEEKLKKYLLYAIGEILLVMIGISLAFQLDNWNENRVKDNTEISYYKNIRDQIAGDKELIERELSFNLDYQRQFGYANGILETMDFDKMDTLGIIVRSLTQYSDFDQQGNIYETLVNSGEIKLLHNLQIVNGIRNLEEKYLYVNRIENIHYDAMITYVVPAINPYLKFSSAEIMKPKAFYTYEFQNLLLSLMQIMEEKKEAYQEVLDEIERVTILIDTELKES